MTKVQQDDSRPSSALSFGTLLGVTGLNCTNEITCWNLRTTRSYIALLRGARAKFVGRLVGWLARRSPVSIATTRSMPPARTPLRYSFRSSLNFLSSTTPILNPPPCGRYTAATAPITQTHSCGWWCAVGRSLGRSSSSSSRPTQDWRIFRVEYIK